MNLRFMSLLVVSLLACEFKICLIWSVCVCGYGVYWGEGSRFNKFGVCRFVMLGCVVLSCVDLGLELNWFVHLFMCSFGAVSITTGCCHLRVIFVNDFQEFMHLKKPNVIDTKVQIRILRQKLFSSFFFNFSGLVLLITRPLETWDHKRDRKMREVIFHDFFTLKHVRILRYPNLSVKIAAVGYFL